jgi:hypothetical protein
MFTKFALAAALVAGTASLALADDGYSFADNLNSQYSQTAPQQRSAPVFTSRNVGLGNGQTTGGVDRASSPYAGGGF